MPVEPWFVPLAYAFILFLDNFGHPCVSWSHVYNKREMNEYPSPRNNASIVPRLMLARKFWAYGKTVVSYNDSGSCMSIIRTGRGTQLSDSPHALIATAATTWGHMYVSALACCRPPSLCLPMTSSQSHPTTAEFLAVSNTHLSQS